MEIFKIVGIGVVATFLVVLLKGTRPEFSLYISIVTGIVVFSMILGELSYVILLYTLVSCHFSRTLIWTTKTTRDPY